MSRSVAVLLGLVAVMPLAVEVPPDSASRTGETRLRAGAGYGSYAFVSRGCSGEVLSRVPVHALDGSIGVDHRFAKLPLRVGVRGGWTRDRIDSATSVIGSPVVSPGGTVYNRYLNPFIEYDSPGHSVGVGWVAHENEFITAGEGAREQASHPLNDVSFHLRAGSERKYFLASWMEGMPIYSDGGYFTTGIGGRLSERRVSGFIGLAAGGPMEGAGPRAGLDVEVAPGLRVGIKGQTNLSNGANVGLGLEYRFAH